MNQVCFSEAVRLVKEGRVKRLITSCAFEQAWRRERDCKVRLAAEQGIDLADVSVFAAIAGNTFEEINHLRDIISRGGITGLVVVGERWHLPRSIELLKAKVPGVEFIPAPVRCTSFERTWEPSFIKSWRAGHQWSWAAWNLLITAITPALIRFSRRH